MTESTHNNSEYKIDKNKDIYKFYRKFRRNDHINEIVYLDGNTNNTSK